MTNDCIVICQPCGRLPGCLVSQWESSLQDYWLLSVSRYISTCGPTMTKRLRLPGISLWIEECIECGASSGLSETLGKSKATRLAQVFHIFGYFSFHSVPALYVFWDLVSLFCDNKGWSRTILRKKELSHKMFYFGVWKNFCCCSYYYLSEPHFWIRLRIEGQELFAFLFWAKLFMLESIAAYDLI